MVFMVAHFNMPTYGVNHEIRFAEGIWLGRKSGQIGFFFLSENTFFYIMRAQRALSNHL